MQKSEQLVAPFFHKKRLPRDFPTEVAIYSLVWCEITT